MAVQEETGEVNNDQVVQQPQQQPSNQAPSADNDAVAPTNDAFSSDGHKSTNDAFSSDGHKSTNDAFSCGDDNGGGMKKYDHKSTTSSSIPSNNGSINGSIIVDNGIESNDGTKIELLMNAKEYLQKHCELLNFQLPMYNIYDKTIDDKYYRKYYHCECIIDTLNNNNNNNNNNTNLDDNDNGNNNNGGGKELKFYGHAISKRLAILWSAYNAIDYIQRHFIADSDYDDYDNGDHRCDDSIDDDVRDDKAAFEARDDDVKTGQTDGNDEHDGHGDHGDDDNKINDINDGKSIDDVDVENGNEIPPSYDSSSSIVTTPTDGEPLSPMVKQSLSQKVEKIFVDVIKSKSKLNTEN